tara:strand:+ start:682 stop:879 length:198 start_codon:yes stop_codon:yes gene_type:complete
MKQEEAIIRVFGITGERNTAQKMVWKMVKDEALRSSASERSRNGGKSARDFCLTLYKTTIRDNDE